MKKLAEPSEELLKSKEKDYSESAFWSKLRKVGSRIGANAFYYALSLFYIMTSGNVSLKDKAYIAGALGYLIVPLDLIPDAIPVLGFTDDISALLTVYNRMKANLTPEMKQQVVDKIIEKFGQDAANHIQTL